MSNVTAGASACSICSFGTFGNTTGLVACHECGAGTFQEARGQLQCEPCAVDTFSAELGATAAAECSKCTSDRTTGGKRGATSRTSCLCKRGKFYRDNATDINCRPCPDGANCNRRDGVIINELVPKAGYWRSDEGSKHFIPCSIGYKGVKKKVEEKSRQRCCPKGKCSVNGSKFNNSDDQCAQGYRGLLCKVCTENYVLVNDECKECDGGASFQAAIVALIVSSFVMFLICWLILFFSASAKSANKGKRYFGQIKIIVSFVQILSAMPNVFEDVPWPDEFLAIVLPLNVFNFDIMGVFAPAQCTLAIRYFDAFIVHMIMPLAFFFAVVVAWLVLIPCSRNMEKRQRRKELMFQMLILIVLCCYPGLATRLFTIFRCKIIPGMNDFEILDVDWNVQCFVGEHLTYVNLAVTFILVYIIGWPLSMFLVLWRQRSHLHDPESLNHPGIRASLGGLYLQCEYYKLMRSLSLTSSLIVCAFGI